MASKIQLRASGNSIYNQGLKNTGNKALSARAYYSIQQRASGKPSARASRIQHRASGTFSQGVKESAEGFR